jgi:hypothetical protein
MFNIFAALRRLFAGPRNSLGYIALDAIRSNIMPRLSGKMKEVGNPAEKEKIQEMMDLWKHWSNESHADSRKWDDIAANTARAFAAKYHLSSQDEEDIIQETALRISSRDSLGKVFNEFDPMIGPHGFMNWWKTVLYNAMYTVSRDFERHQPEHMLGERSDISVEDVSTSGGGLDSNALREIRKDLDSHIERKFHGDETALIVYNEWMDKADQIGAEGIVFSRHILKKVEEKLKKKKMTYGKSTINNAWIRVQKAIKDFFRGEEAMSISAQTKPRQSVASNLKLADRLAYVEYRRRLAAWVLGR